MAIVELLRAMPKPVIAAVNGACAGAGIAWACACDIRLAGRSAFFTTAYLDAGLAGDYGITWTLPRIVGAGRASELLLAGIRLTADDACWTTASSSLSQSSWPAGSRAGPRAPSPTSRRISWSPRP
jgi:enoyl-CoA hydratase/carnithine racemase